MPRKLPTVSHKVRPRQRGGDAPPTLHVHRHLPTAVRKGTSFRGTGIPESSHRRLDPEHGNDHADGSVAHAYDAADRRSIQHQYDRAKHRRGHCASGLRRQSHSQPSVAGDFYNLNAFALPPATPAVSAPAASVSCRGPVWSTWTRVWPNDSMLANACMLRFEATFTNVINHTNYAPPSLNLGEPSSFGVLNAALPQGEGGNRTGQLALHMDF